MAGRVKRYGKRPLRCVYCGHRVMAWSAQTDPPACGAHRDLPVRDPKYAEPDQWAAAR